MNSYITQFKPQLFTAAIMVCLSLGTVGCSTVNITKTGKGFHNPTAPSEVEIRGTVPKENYEEVGMVSGDIFGGGETAYNELRKKAAALGADAVIISNQTPIGLRTIINGVAIKYVKRPQTQ